MWQMLLKGITEVQTATRPAAAAEMVLVRIAYVADLPTPDEAIRMLEQNGGAIAGCLGSGAAPSRAAPAATGIVDASSLAPVRAPIPRHARRRRGVRAPADGRADGRGAVRAACCGSPAFRSSWRSPAKSAISLTKAGAGSRRPAGPHRGRPARGSAGAQRGAHAGQRSLAQAGAMDRAALDRDRVQRSRAADAAFAERAARRTSASAPRKPIRGCRRCWRDFPAPRSSRCAGLPPSRRNPILSLKTRPRVPTDDD